MNNITITLIKNLGVRRIFVTTFFILVLLLSLNIHNNITDVWATQYYPLTFQLFIFVAGIILMIRNFIGKYLVLSALDGIIILYLAYSFINATLSIGNLYHTNDAYLQIAYLILYLITKDFAKDKNIYWQLIFLITGFATVQIVLGLAHALYYMDLTIAIKGTFINSGLYGGYLACTFLLVPLLKRRYSKYKLVFLVLATIWIIAIILSKSRAAYIALTISLIIVNINFVKLKSKNFFKKTLAFLLFVSFVVLAIWLLYKIRPSSADGRLMIWKISIPMTERFPISGNGAGFVFNNFNFYQAKYFDSGMGTSAEKNIAGQTYSVFNEYLRILIEDGLIGFLLFVSVVLLAAYAVFQQPGKNEAKYIGCGILGFMVFSIFSYPLSIQANTVIFYILLALLSNAVNFKFYKIKLSFGLLLPIATLVFLLFNVIITLRAIYKWEQAKKFFNYNEARAIGTYGEIKPVLINNQFFLYNYGAMLTDLEDYKQGLTIFLSCKNKTISLYSQIGRCYEKLNRPDEAERNYKMAAAVTPNALNPKDLLFSFYKNTNQVAKGRALAVEITNTPIKIYTKRAVDISNAAWLYLYQSH